MIDGPPEPGERARSWPVRLAWFAGLAFAGSAACAAVAYAMRAVLFTA